MSKTTETILSRKIGKTSLNGIIASTFQKVKSILTEYEKGKAFIISDLIGGISRPNQVATEFLNQLFPATNQKDAQQPDRNINAKNGQLTFSGLAGMGIDMESRGDITFLNASKFCKKILENESSKAKCYLIFIPHEAAANILKENIRFIHLFSQLVDKINSSVYIIAKDKIDYLNPYFDVSWKLIENQTDRNKKSVGLSDLIPGIVNGNILEPEEQQHYRPLENGFFYIPLEYRKENTSSKLSFDKLATTYKDNEYLAAFAQFNGNNFFVDISFLVGKAWTCFFKGSQELCLRYLEKAYSCSKSINEKSVIGSQMQGIRISCWEFEKTANYSLPSSGVPEAISVFLLLSKAWGAALSNNLEIAGEAFGRLKDLIKDDQSMEYCYYLNIYAFYQLKSKQMDKAIALEQEIEEIWEKSKEKDYKLLYVNSINQLRLNKYISDENKTNFYFKRAFSSNKGLRNENDLAYLNLIQYTLSKDPEASYLSLVKAVVCWLASPFPESITKRIASVISFKDNGDFDGLPIALSNYFINELETNSKTRIKHIAYHHAPLFRSASQVKEAEQCHARSDFAVYTDFEDREALISNPEFLQLRRSCFDAIMDILDHPGFEKKPKSIIIDLGYGDNVTDNSQDILLSGARLNVKAFFYNNKYQTLKWKHKKIIDLAFLSIAPGVDQIKLEEKKATIQFKRHRKNKTYEQENICALLMDLYKNKKTITVGECLDKTDDGMDLLNELQDNRIIKLSITKEVCEKAGFK